MYSSQNLNPLPIPKASGDRKSIYLPGTTCAIKSQISLASLTSFRVGGPAEWYVAPQNLAELQASLEWARTEGLAVTLIGAGSNLLVSDRGLPGLVIGTRHLRYSRFDLATGQLTVAAGEPLPRVAWQVAELGWQGLEWAVGIPGSVGGQVLSPTGELETFTPDQLSYSYRTSILQGSQRLVTQATFQLQPGADPQQVLATTTEHLEQRRRTQPYHLPSCGSVFRNPLPYTAGWLIEQSGLKGYQIGAAQVAQRHANFILNCGGAKASDIWQLIRHVQYQVEQRWSLLLEPEVKTIGEF